VPADVAIEHRPTSWGVMRSRAVGTPRDGVPEVVAVPGLTVANYLLPAVSALGTWTRAPLVELPGFSGRGEPPHPLDVPQFADALAQWLGASGRESVVLVGHSSGTRVAARVAARRRQGTRALVLAGPTIDSRFRSMRRVRHALSVHLADALEDVVPDVAVPRARALRRPGPALHR
jgi:pimeloyl-ACP methyl ester carboxylesterase